MRLSQGMKDRMRSKITCEKFAEKSASIDTQLRQLADDIYNSLPDIAKVADVPSGWLSLASYVHCSFNGLRDCLWFSEPKPLPNLFNKLQHFSIEHPFCVRFTAIHAAQQAYTLQERELNEELKKVLSGVSTDKQLLAIWPEASKWLPAAATLAPVPVVQSAERLKQLLGTDL